MNTFERLIVMMVGVGLASVYATNATACETDEDCGAGYVCTTYSYVTPDCDSQPDCAEDDAECLDKLAEIASDCDGGGEVIEDSYCERASCEVDADCGDTMICLEYESRWCSGSDGEVCDDDGCEIVEEDPVCGVDVYRECGYPYEAPCMADADCGAGFTCVPEEICSCSAGSDESVYDADSGIYGIGATEEDLTEECSCEPTGENYCQLQEIECTDDADCPEGLSCIPVYSGGDCIAYDDGEVACDESEAVSMCRPDGWNADDIGEDSGDVNTGTDDENDVDDEDDGNIFDDINLGVFFGGCSVSTPAGGSAKIGIMDLFSLL